MNIGIDIDNVISNFDEVLKKEFLIHDKELRNTGIINPEAYMTKGMFDWTDDEIWTFYLENIGRITPSLDVIEGASKYIKKLKQDGHTIYIISGRDNGEYTDSYNMTKNWLEKYDITYDKLFLVDAYNSHSKTVQALLPSARSIPSYPLSEVPGIRSDGKPALSETLLFSQHEGLPLSLHNLPHCRSNPFLLHH